MLDLREASRQHMPVVPNMPALKDAAIATWKARMVNEYGSSRVFEGLYEQLSPLGLAESDLERLRSFAEDERRHGVLCGSVVEALGGARGTSKRTSYWDLCRRMRTCKLWMETTRRPSLER